MSALNEYYEALLSGSIQPMPYVCQDDKERWLSQSGVRLYKTWKLFKKDSRYQIDFEICLRDFLLCTKEDFHLPDYVLSEFGKNELGLTIHNGVVSTLFHCPSFLNDEFVRQAYDGRKTEVSHHPDVDLTTDSYISGLIGFKAYRSLEQKYAVLGSLNTPAGDTTLVSMPTGGGKSLVMQAVAYQQDGLTIIIVPTISLMIDQVKNTRALLKPKNEEEIDYYSSDRDDRNIKKRLDDHVLRMLYISPEAIMKNPLLRETIENANNTHYLKNLVIDEAHIIVEWGASFRIDFQCIDALRRNFIKTNPGLRTFLLSATFSRRTVNILKNSFGTTGHWHEIRCDALRKEQRYSIVFCKSANEKYRRKMELIALLPHPMIVYVRSPDEAEILCQELMGQGINNVRTFSGRTSAKRRNALIDSWKNNEFEIMIATSAFGVGVDKPDVRTVLHLYVPANPNAFYQEAGRGGRDGFPCLSILLCDQEDRETAYSFTQKVITEEKLRGRWFSMIQSVKTQRFGNGDVMLDTSVKPNYALDEDFFDWVNDGDVTWNVYVILLLKRHGVLEVDKVVYQNDKYLFQVHLKDSRYFEESPSVLENLKNIRDQEWNSVYEEFRMMDHMIEERKREGSRPPCVSETFCDIFDLAEQYCSGCDGHDDIIDDTSDTNLLKNRLDMSVAYHIDPLPFFSSTNSIVISQNLSSLRKRMDRHVNSWIETEKDREDIQDYSFQRFSLWEFLKYHDKIRCLLGKTICITLPTDEEGILSVLRITQSMEEQEDDVHFIFFVEEDSFLPSRGKRISEIIDHRVNDYLI